MHDSCHLIQHFSFFSWKVTNSLAESTLFIHIPCVINSNPTVERVKTGEILELASQPSLISVLKRECLPSKREKKKKGEWLSWGIAFHCANAHTCTTHTYAQMCVSFHGYSQEPK